MPKTDWSCEILQKLRAVFPLGVSQKQLQDELEIDSSYMSKNLQILENRKLIKRISHPGSSGNAKRIYLEEKGLWED